MGWFDVILRPSPETSRKMALARKLLRDGVSIRAALRHAGLAGRTTTNMRH